MTAEYQEWGAGRWRNYGMRHKVTGAEHGIVRKVYYNGRVIEATYLDGRKHGLCRECFNVKVNVHLHRFGAYLTGFAFSFNFTETGRDGPQPELLHDLSPAEFIKEIPIERRKPKHQRSKTIGYNSVNYTAQTSSLNIFKQANSAPSTVAAPKTPD
jgi:hypothetical protein